MCISMEEMNRTMAEIKEWKRIKEEAEDNISALNKKVIDFLEENESCGATDKKETQFVNLSAKFIKLHTLGQNERP